MIPVLPTPAHLDLAKTSAGAPSMRDPDHIMADYLDQAPDPVGMWLTRRLEQVGDALAAMRESRRERTAPVARTDKAVGAC